MLRRGTALAGLAMAFALAMGGGPILGQGGARATAKPRLSPVRHVAVGDLEIGYRTGGSGPHLVLITGRSATMADWDPRLLDRLMQRRTVLVFDNRAVATTSPGSLENGILQMAEDTAGLMQALGIPRADVLAWSMGGYVAQALAVNHPELVRRLVLSATNAGGPFYRQPGPLVRTLLDSGLGPAPLFALSFPATRAGRRAQLGYLARVATQPGLVPDSFTLDGIARSGQLLATTQWKQQGLGGALRDLRLPVLVADGALDVIDRAPNGRLLARLIPRAGHCVFAGAGHAFLFQYPKLYATAVERFLGPGSVLRYSRRVPSLHCSRLRLAGIGLERRRCAGRVPTIVGTPGRDVIRGSPLRDVISGFGGPDVILGIEGNDIVCGGGDRDRLVGGHGADLLLGQGAADALLGGAGADRLSGDRGNDLLVGGPGPDRCAGGAGRDAVRSC